MTTTAPEIVSTSPNQLALVIEKAGLAPASSEALKAAFIPLAESAAVLIDRAATIRVTDASQLAEMEQAHSVRVQLKGLRVAADKHRAAFKADYLRGGNAIQSIYNYLAEKIEPVEEMLQQQEDFAKRVEALRNAEIKADRERQLRTAGADPAAYMLDHMPEAMFNQILSGVITARDAKIAADKLAEEKRIEAEKVRTEEEARVKAENARLRKEAEEREAAAKAERDRLAAEAKAAQDKADAALAEQKRIADESAKVAAAKAKAEREAAEAIARTEREAREKLQREADEAKAAEDRRVAAETEAARKAAAAPDQEKLMTLARTIRATELPKMATTEADEMTLEIRQWIDELADRIERNAKVL